MGVFFCCVGCVKPDLGGALCLSPNPKKSKAYQKSQIPKSQIPPFPDKSRKSGKSHSNPSKFTTLVCACPCAGTIAKHKQAARVREQLQENAQNAAMEQAFARTLGWVPPCAVFRSPANGMCLPRAGGRCPHATITHHRQNTPAACGDGRTFVHVSERGMKG